jgi:hypothetical protein
MRPLLANRSLDELAEHVPTEARSLQGRLRDSAKSLGHFHFASHPSDWPRPVSLRRPTAYSSPPITHAKETEKDIPSRDSCPLKEKDGDHRRKSAGHQRAAFAGVEGAVPSQRPQVFSYSQPRQFPLVSNITLICQIAK